MQRGVVYNKEDEVEDNGYEILRANNISLNNQLDLSDIKMISKKVHISPTQQLHKDDILLCVASGSAVHIGKVAYIINDTQYYFGGFMAAIRCDENQVLPKYLYYLLADTRFKEYLNAAIAGANIKNINKKILGNFKIPLPSTITEQQAIEAELDSYQKIIDAAKTIVDNYKPQIDIDPNWPMVALGEIIKLSSGNGLTSRQIVQGDYPVYGGNGLIGLHNQYFVENPTIVIGRVGAYCGSIHITHPKSWITDNGLYVVNIKRPVLLEYLAIMLKDLNLHQYAKIGGQPSISQSVVYDKQIPLPDINIQKEIVSQLNQEQKYIDNAKELINVFMEKMNKRIAKIWNE